MCYDLLRFSLCSGDLCVTVCGYIILYISRIGPLDSPPPTKHTPYCIMLCFDRPPVESPSQTTTIHGYLLLPVLYHSLAVNTHACVVVTLLYLYRMVCTPPTYTAKPSSGCVHDHQSHTMVTPAEEGLIASRSYTSGWLTHSHSQLSHSHSHSHSHRHAARVRESSRVRTDGGTYILLETTTTVAIVLLHNNNNNNNNNQPMQEKVLSLLQLVADLLIIIVREHRDGEWHFVLPSSASLKGRSMVCFSSSVVVGRRWSVVGGRWSVVGGHYFSKKSYAGGGYFG